MKKRDWSPLRRSSLWILLLLVGIAVLPNEWFRLKQVSSSSTTSYQDTLTSVPKSTKELQASPVLTGETLPPRKPCKVFRIIDGDTISCDLNGNGTIESPNEKIRFLQVDTPETKRSRRNPTGKIQPFGLEAKAYTQNRTAHQVVYLAFDKRIRDYYGRTLAWVYLDPKGGESVNAGLLKSGLAKVMIYAPNHAQQDEMKQLEAQAKANGRGLWQRRS